MKKRQKNKVDTSHEFKQSEVGSGSSNSTKSKKPYANISLTETGVVPKKNPKSHKQY
jgi:hypothetical protein